MEEARGSDLGALWGTMEPEEKNAVVEGVVAVEKKLSSLAFSRSDPL